MGTGIGIDCKRCGGQLNYDDGFEEGFCNRCFSIVNYEEENGSAKIVERRDGGECEVLIVNGRYFQSWDLEDYRSGIKEISKKLEIPIKGKKKETLIEEIWTKSQAAK